MKISLSRDNNFDFLRFLAASLVLFSHSFVLYGVSGEPFAAMSGFETFGGLAVATFFILSGFLISASYTKRPHLMQYIKNRVLRILPGCYVVIVLTVLFMGCFVTTLPFREYIMHQATRAYFGNFILYPIHYNLPGVFAENPAPNSVNGSLWTLSVEFLMYAMIAVMGVTRILCSRIGGIIMLALSVTALIYYASIDRQDTAQWLIIKSIFFFLAGATIWHYREKLRLNLWVFSILLLAVILSCKTTYGDYVFMVCLPYIVLFMGLHPVPVLKDFGRYGDFSYGMYLYAYPIQQTYIYFFIEQNNFWLFVVVSWLATFCMAIFSWYMVERPCLRLKEGFNHKP